MNQQNRKKHAILCLLAFVAVTTVTLALRLAPRTLPPGLCGDLYRRYAGNPDIRASFIKDKRFDDSIYADMTILEALTDTGWALLQHDLAIPTLPKELEYRFYMDSDQVSVKNINRANPSIPADSIDSNNDLAVICRPRRTVSVFSITDSIQCKTICFYYYKKNIAIIIKK